MSHTPVLINEVMAAFADRKLKPRSYFDGTFGRGGHLRAVLGTYPEIQAKAMDTDTVAIEHGQKNFSKEIADGRLELVHKNFSEYRPEEDGHFDLMLLDLGVSSPQLDEAERGFSFYHDGPLDMRMNPESTAPSAADLINGASEDQLIDIFKTYGEVHRPFRVVRAVVHDRKETPFTRTQQLSGLIERIDGWHKKGHHPATRYFMALRLAVNHELENLQKALPHLIAGLNEGGRLVIISFHSLEDRIVKQFFRDQKQKSGFPVNKKVIQAQDQERDANPRARSAKLRIFEKRSLTGENR